MHFFFAVGATISPLIIKLVEAPSLESSSSNSTMDEGGAAHTEIIANISQSEVLLWSVVVHLGSCQCWNVAPIIYVLCPS